MRAYERKTRLLLKEKFLEYKENGNINDYMACCEFAQRLCPKITDKVIEKIENKARKEYLCALRED